MIILIHLYLLISSCTNYMHNHSLADMAVHDWNGFFKDFHHGYILSTLFLILRDPEYVLLTLRRELFVFKCRGNKLTKTLHNLYILFNSFITLHGTEYLLLILKWATRQHYILRTSMNTSQHNMQLLRERPIIILYFIDFVSGLWAKVHTKAQGRCCYNNRDEWTLSEAFGTGL